jgi:hypothetical protein
MVDLTGWQFWWEFNKDPFLKLREAILEGPPQTGDDSFYLGSTRRSAKNYLAVTEKDKLNILATLRRAMQSTTNPDIITACMIAGGKAVDRSTYGTQNIPVAYLKKGACDGR